MTGGEGSAMPRRRRVRPDEPPNTFILRDAVDKARFIARLQRAELLDEKGRPLIVFARRLKKKRTPGQNRHMHLPWGYFDLLADWSKGEAKEWFKEQHGPVVERVLGGVRRTIPKPSSEYTPQEAQTMIDTIYRIAGESGFVIPDKNDADSWARFAAQLEAEA